MKYIITLIICFCVGMGPAVAQLQQEMQTVWFSVDKEDPARLMEPGESFEKRVTIEKRDYPVRRFFRVVGNVRMPEPFSPRGEGNFRDSETILNDHIDSVNVYKDRYSLYFQGNNDAFEREAYNRVSVPQIQPGRLTVEIPVKREKLAVSKEGEFGVELQVYLRKEGRHPHDVYDQADTVMFMPIPAGSGSFKLMKKDFILPDHVTTVLVKLGGTFFSGRCWMEAPRFYQSGQEVFGDPFTPYQQRTDDYNYWVSVNLSSRSWPMWKLEFKGKTIFQGNLFDWASNIADFYIPLPDNLPTGEGDLKLTLVKEPYKASFPYELRSVQLLEESARSFEVVSIPKYVSVGDTAGILIEVNEPGVSLQVKTEKAIQIIQPNQRFDNTGLYVINLVALTADTDIPVEVSMGQDVRKGKIDQTIVKEKDNIYLSSGDDVYIDNDVPIYDYYFKWYVRERVGNWLQFRPSYQWSGVRITTDEFVKRYTGLLDKLHMPYAWQVDARTLGASRINTTAETLSTPHFRGKQSHENDGGYYYWTHQRYMGLHTDLRSRALPFGGIYAKHRPLYTDHGIFVRYDPEGANDMAEGAALFVAGLNTSRGESTRHTGPSAAFRYLYQAGYDWLGAEQMYGPENVIMSALRGASRAYRKKDYGTLHAMQWGSYYGEPKHALRFYMSMAIAYMHGASHINTEEAIFIDEWAHDRYTKEGKEHLHAQLQIMDYIQTHGRRGNMYTPIAVMYGRNDPWKSFANTQNAWSQKDTKWQFNKAMESFDLLKIFYPENVINFTGPEGWFTPTPYGAIDILPVEAADDVMQQYKLLVFLGWNTFDNADFIRLHKFVERGGTLLLTAAHMNSELQPDKPPTFPADDRVIKNLLGEDYKFYQAKTVIPVGKGRVIYYPQHVYPADNEIRADYTECIKSLAAETLAGEPVRGWVKDTPYIDFTVWDTNCSRTLYILNTDWETETAWTAAFVLNGKEFAVPANRYTMGTIHSSKSVAAMPTANTSAILSIEEEAGKWVITCQTTGADEVLLMNGLTGETKKHRIQDAGIHRIEVTK